MSRPVWPEQYEPSWLEEAWVTCATCNGDGCVRDGYGLDVTCQDCLGDGGVEP